MILESLSRGEAIEGVVLWLHYWRRYSFRRRTIRRRFREEYGVLCGVVGILFNVLLFAGKFLAGTISHSIAITADAVNNLSDADLRS